MCEAPSKLHMHHMVKVDTIVFDIVMGWEHLKHPPPPHHHRLVSCLKYPGLDKDIKLIY